MYIHACSALASVSVLPACSDGFFLAGRGFVGSASVLGSTQANLTLIEGATSCTFKSFLSSFNTVGDACRFDLIEGNGFGALNNIVVPSGAMEALTANVTLTLGAALSLRASSTYTMTTVATSVCQLAELSATCVP